MCRRSCPRRCGCSLPATAARVTRSMRTRWPWPPCVRRTWSGLRSMPTWSRVGLLVDRRDELGRARTQTVNRLHRVLLELFPGGAKKFLSATQARALVATIKPRDLVGKTRRRLAVELISELESIDKKSKAADKNLTELVTARGSTLTDLRHRPGRRGPPLGRRGRPPAVPRPGPVRLLERHRPAGRLLRRPATPPTLPSRKPPHQPHPAHHGSGATAQCHRGPRLFRCEKGRRQDIDGKPCALSNDASPTWSTPACAPTRNVAKRQARRALGDDSESSVTGPTPAHRPFGQAPSRTCHHPSLASPYPRGLDIKGSHESVVEGVGRVRSGSDPSTRRSNAGPACGIATTVDRGLRICLGSCPGRGSLLVEYMQWTRDDRMDSYGIMGAVTSSMSISPWMQGDQVRNLPKAFSSGVNVSIPGGVGG
jgi:hypothetical protein